jgi:hypothetical protein
VSSVALVLSKIPQNAELFMGQLLDRIHAMRSIWRAASVTGHLLLVVAALVAVLTATSHAAFPPLRVAMVALVAVLSAVTLFGRFPLGLGPVAGSVTARIVRMVGTALAGIGATGVVLGFAQGGSPSGRANSGVPQLTVVLAVYLAAFLAITTRDSGLPPRAMLMNVGLGLLAAALFAAAVPVLPPGLVFGLALLLIAAAAAGAAGLTRPAESRGHGALLATVTACQALFFAAAVLYQYGPDAWMPYAGPGPLTPQGQLEQNRAEAIDPYVGPLLLGAVAATILIAIVVTARLRARTEASTAVPVA